ncbi:MAG TPA: Pycsar system effector family protein [Chitinophagaceae bacterium]|nr:Pycsar system effector family protein [Chitinophagaceae bacterium]
MNFAQLLEQVKLEVTRFFHTNENSALTYHNLAHTEGVVLHAGQIANHFQLADREFFIVLTAAWYHDTGYLTGTAIGHEQKGADMAILFLKESGVDDITIKEVWDCIMATRMPQRPQKQLEKIVCDADLYHLGTSDFLSNNKLLRKETEWRMGRKIPKSEWRKSTIKLLEEHHYQTDYCRQFLEETKQMNLNKLKEKDDSGTEDPVAIEPAPVAGSADQVHQPAKEKKVKNDRPDKGIETMFRISSSNHQRLSDMADNKSHIMITTTSIIISVLLSLLLRKLEDNPYLVIPTLLLLTVCVVTMVFCILATRPSLPSGNASHEDILQKKVNLLFFGNFYKMSFSEYDMGMKQMMNDRDYLYGSLIKDLYSQGRVLGRIYRLLRIGYNVFMFGIVASVLAFVVAVVFFGH